MSSEKEKRKAAGFTLPLFRVLMNQMFDSDLELKVRLFNGLALVGTTVGTITTAAALIFNPEPGNLLINVAISLGSLGILLLSIHTGRYNLCYLLSIIAIFGGLFTGLYLTSGAYKGGMPLYFLLAILFTVYMLRGKLGVIVSLLELLWYTGLLLLALKCPELVNWFPTEGEIVTDVLISFLVTAVSLAATQALENRIYDRQQAELNAALAAKNRFLGSISHEIRTPINMIMGMNQMILRENGDPIIHEYALRVQNSGEYMLELVDSLLDMSKIEAGRMELLIRAYDPAGMFRILFTEFGRQAEEKGLRFSYRIGEMPDRLMGDAMNIRQIISNIITNALKYTKEGQISVWVSYDDGSLEFEVKDTGIGIKPEKMDTIFDTFVRAGQDSGVNVDGVGLGLSIVKRLVDMMGGTISVESEYGTGSLFSVTIPQEIASAEDEKPEEASSEADLYIPEVRILSCDDREENLYVLESLLHHTGASITSVSSGARSLDALRTGKYDIVFMDYMMPEMDGVETLKRIRQIPGCRNMTVIALTADVQSSTRKYLIGSGFDDYLRKPVSIEALHKVLRQHIPPEKIRAQVKEPGTCELISGEDARMRMKRLDVNLDKGLKLHGDRLEEYYQVCRIFRQCFRRNMDDLNAALGAENPGMSVLPDSDVNSEVPVNLIAAARIAHALKSSARSVGAELLSAEAELFERKCLENDEIYIRVARPLIQMQWERACSAAEILCEHVQIDEPEAEAVAAPAQELTVEEKAERKEELVNSLRDALRRYEGYKAGQILQELAYYVDDTEADHAESDKAEADREEADSAEEAEVLEKIREHIENVDFAEAESLLDGLMGREKG